MDEDLYRETKALSSHQKGDLAGFGTGACRWGGGMKGWMDRWMNVCVSNITYYSKLLLHLLLQPPSIKMFTKKISATTLLIFRTDLTSYSWK